MQTSFDITIYAPRTGYAVIHHHTKNGKDFVEQAAGLQWSPMEVLQNIPPKLLVGIRTSTKKKFTQLPVTSLH